MSSYSTRTGATEALSASSSSSSSRSTGASMDTKTSSGTTMTITGSTKEAVQRAAQYIKRRRAVEMAIHSIDESIYEAREKNKFGAEYRELAYQDTEYLALKHNAERALLKMLTKATTDQKLALCFRMVDLNQDEDVDAFELAKTLQLIQADTNFLDALQASRMSIMANDEDDNEVLCFSEFVKFLGSTSTFLKITIDELAHFLIMEIGSLYDGQFIINETCDKDLYCETHEHCSAFVKMTDIEKVRLVVLFELLDSFDTGMLDFGRVARVMTPVSQQMDPAFRKHLFSSSAIYNNGTGIVGMRSMSSSRCGPGMGMSNSRGSFKSTPEDSTLMEDHGNTRHHQNPNALNFTQFVEFYSKVVKASPAELTFDRIANIITTAACEESIDAIDPHEKPMFLFEDVHLSGGIGVVGGTGGGEQDNGASKRRNSLKSKTNFSTGDLSMLQVDADGYFSLNSDQPQHEDSRFKMNHLSCAGSILPEKLRSVQQTLSNAFNEELGFENTKISQSSRELSSITHSSNQHHQHHRLVSSGSPPSPHHHHQTSSTTSASKVASWKKGALDRVSSHLNFGLNDELQHSTRSNRSVRMNEPFTSQGDHTPSSRRVRRVTMAL